jgi:hypothetical protein
MFFALGRFAFAEADSFAELDCHRAGVFSQVSIAGSEVRTLEVTNYWHVCAEL